MTTVYINCEYSNRNFQRNTENFSR